MKIILSSVIRKEKKQGIWNHELW